VNEIFTLRAFNQAMGAVQALTTRIADAHGTYDLIDEDSRVLEDYDRASEQHRAAMAAWS